MKLLDTHKSKFSQFTYADGYAHGLGIEIFPCKMLTPITSLVRRQIETNINYWVTALPFFYTMTKRP